MQKKKRWFNLGAGWLKNGSRGDYISAVSGGDKAKGDLIYRDRETGEEIAVKTFAVFFKEEKASERSPDVEFVMSVE